MSWLWIIGAYLCGSIPFGLLIAKAVTGADVRAVGSGNIGATNVARAAGRPAAIATLVLDALKGAVPVLFAARTPQAPPMLASACAFAAVLGHCFPVWLRLRGGKGVATGFGVALAVAPWAAAAGAVTWLVAYKLLRISSVGSLAGVAVALGVASLTADRYAVYGLLGIALLIILRHRPNIRRLLARQEGQTPPPKGT
ncbi:MAG: acyl-phosphate glycerol 3-phosphate acyltransferase [Deltaproteobacteria bacterium 13_1_20CM_2_69_21]|nr:MAG: acyl-phosphate glycerol 3-phosphate acyltransferase [Deltaproteobacteria bacterium 13_1_40CM_4_68_19]OLD46877.1 MAG: acyl-phosphate glycerol 3-phosphate acyltransferase [Chloroflexi bacterium 13_1_40CM_2_68_14]OLE64104.1 MAG: acyl-phosphate glycerol 3-phosphate acyltransferase [Deltaproteobacteria bacterium 13_1_20CM_2_69_21]